MDFCSGSGEILGYCSVSNLSCGGGKCRGDGGGASDVVLGDCGGVLPAGLDVFGEGIWGVEAAGLNGDFVGEDNDWILENVAVLGA